MIVPIVIVDEQLGADRPLNGRLLSSLLQHAAALDGQPQEDFFEEQSLSFTSPVIIASNKSVGSYVTARSGSSWYDQRTIVAAPFQNRLCALVAAALSVCSLDQILFLPAGFNGDVVTLIKALREGTLLATRGRFVRFDVPFANSWASFDEAYSPLPSSPGSALSGLLLVSATVFLNAVLDFDKATLEAAELAVADATRYGMNLFLARRYMSIDGPSVDQFLESMGNQTDWIMTGNRPS